MSREIKFRAWDKYEKKYESEVGVIPNGWRENVTEEGWRIRPNDKYWVIEQYTGLKDRNGKEIYEGDIVSKEYAGGDTQPLVVHFDETEAQFQVGGFGIDPTRVEVIGNIHEIELKESRNVEMVKRILKGNDE